MNALDTETRAPVASNYHLHLLLFWIGVAHIINLLMFRNQKTLFFVVDLLVRSQLVRFRSSVKFQYSFILEAKENYQNKYQMSVQNKVSVMPRIA